jgi:hypothetical protein
VRILRRPGFRFVVEALAILLAALVAGMRDVGWPGIIAAVAVVWVIAALTEYSLSGPRRTRPARAAAPEAAGESVRVLRREDELDPVPVPYAVPVAAVDDPQRQPDVLAVEEDAAVADVAVEEVAGDGRVQRPEPGPGPGLETEPEPEPQTEPEPEAEPQRWNIWELDRAVRENGDATEEQEFLLLYLRDYADPDGLLPLDFDELVRDSFGDALVVAG